MKNKLRPIDIARRLNLSTSTLRGYENRGIVPVPERLATGYRVYTEEHLAYFECIVAMSPGFGMDVTAAVLQNLQQKKLNSALWLINEVQAANYEDKKLTIEVIKHLEHDLGSPNSQHSPMTIGELSSQANIPTSTLRYWEKKGYITSSRNEHNNYRFFHSDQHIKILLMKLIQNAVYSDEVVELKNAIRSLAGGDIEEARIIVARCQQYLDQRNQEQLHGVHFLYRLCSILGLN